MQTPWSTEVELAKNGETVVVQVMLSTDGGPARMFRPFLDVDLDEAHATELLGKLGLALTNLRQARERADLMRRERQHRREAALTDPAAHLAQLDEHVASFSELVILHHFSLERTEEDLALLAQLMAEHGWRRYEGQFLSWYLRPHHEHAHA